MAEGKRGGVIFKAVSLMVTLLTWVLLSIGVVWVFGVLWFDFPLVGLRKEVAVFFGMVVVLALLLVRPRWRAKWGVALCMGLVLLWWLSLQPRQYRDWKTELALTPYATVDGDLVTLYQVRNFEYRTKGEFTPRYETRRLDLKKLQGVDVFINYWGSRFIAHPIMSFDFGEDGHVCFSIEARYEKGESYSTLGGFYRQFELVYVVAEESDVIGLRTNFRESEDVYLYRLRSQKVRESFLEYIRAVNELHETPLWYNALTNNCTTAMRHQRSASDRVSWDYRILVNGLADELLYEHGFIDTSLPFAELKRISRINERAKAAYGSADFSEKIREGLPGMDSGG